MNVTRSFGLDLLDTIYPHNQPHCEEITKAKARLCQVRTQAASPDLPLDRGTDRTSQAGRMISLLR
jgi:hypothetical protein